jgi:hypothetical protein
MRRSVNAVLDDEILIRRFSLKIIILKYLINLNDDKTELQVTYLCSFHEFLGLGVMNNIPDATTIAFSEKGFVRPE